MARGKYTLILHPQGGERQEKNFGSKGTAIWYYREWFHKWYRETPAAAYTSITATLTGPDGNKVELPKEL